ncbi:MAG: DNA-formamidopyrimidine glycosylase [Spirulina sp. SIO3F2]|nr:DNA-formamidopyrimidine glycosylase [Spirulina sp. SIO3F2]
MPELPEVETVRRGLVQLTQNQTLQGGKVLLKRTLAHPVSASEFIEQLQGQTFQDWQRRGKYLLAQLSGGGVLGVHLRMTGQLFWVGRDRPLEKHTRIRLFCQDNQELRFVDTRTFGQMWLVPPKTPPETIITGLQRLGPEPFAPEFTVEYLTQRLRRTRRTIKAALLDQYLVAGLGNIYADEVLFVSGVRPDRVAADLKASQIRCIHAAIPQVLEAAIAKGGTTFSDFLSLLGVPGNYGDAAQVYGRTGEPCKVCGEAIERIKITGRSTHFCPRCQT